MGSSIYRTEDPSSNETPQPSQKQGDIASTHDDQIEPPYTDYKTVHHHPYLVDHFKLGDTWQDKLGGFEKEISTIEGYFQGKIGEGQLKNEVSAVKDEIKKIYRLCNIDNNERTTMQIEKLAAYIEFLKKTDNIKLNHQRYVQT